MPFFTYRAGVGTGNNKVSYPFGCLANEQCSPLAKIFRGLRPRPLHEQCILYSGAARKSGGRDPAIQGVHLGPPRDATSDPTG